MCRQSLARAFTKHCKALSKCYGEPLSPQGAHHAFRIGHALEALQVSHKQHSHPAVPVAGSEQVLQGPLCSTSTLAHLAMQGLP